MTQFVVPLKASENPPGAGIAAGFVNYLIAVTTAAAVMAISVSASMILGAHPSGAKNAILGVVFLFFVAWALILVAAAAPFTLAQIVARMTRWDSGAYWSICGSLAGLAGAFLITAAMRDGPPMMWASPDDVPVSFWSQYLAFAPGSLGAGIAGGLVYWARARRPRRRR